MSSDVLPGAGRPADGDDLARLDLEVEAAQHVVLAPVGEVDTSKRTAERPARERPRRCGSGSGSIPSSHAKLRPAEASARCAEVR